MDIEKFLKQLKDYGRENDIPNITETNAKFLRNIIKIGSLKNGLEIGTANGYSAIQFGLEFKKNSGNLTTIEFSPNSHAQAIENIKSVGLENTVNLINGNAIDIIPKLEEVYDFVFIDGMKKRSVDFLDLVWDKTKENGVIIIDDVIKFKHKMTGLYEYLQEKKIDYTVMPIDEDDGIMMIIKD